MYDARMERGNDSEGCDFPFFDCMAKEGPQEFIEDAVPEGRKTEVQQEPNSEAKADEHINIPEETLVTCVLSLRVWPLAVHLPLRYRALTTFQTLSLLTLLGIARYYIKLALVCI
jgi:hypothetical protein